MSKRLPDVTQAKLAQLMEDEQQALFALSSTQRQMSEINRSLTMSPDGDRELALRRELTFQQNSLSRHQSRHRELSTLNAYLRQFLERLPADCEIVQSKGLNIKLLPEEDHIAAVNRVRGEIARFTIERTRIERADIDLYEKKVMISEWVARQRERGAPFIRWVDNKPVVTFGARVENAHSPIPDIGAMLTWLNPKNMEAKLHALIEAAPQPAFSVSSEERAIALKELNKHLLALERQEEQLIMAAAGRDQRIARRPNADARAVLQIIIRTAETKIARMKRRTAA